MYWRDSGLLHALRNVPDESALFHQPWVGASWEGYVIEQTLAALQHSDRDFQAHYLRTSDQREIDLVIQVGAELWALEAKLTTRPSRNDLARLNANANLIDANRTFLVCRQSRFVDGGSQIVCDLDGLVRFIASHRP